VQIPVYIYAPEEDGQFQPGRCSRWWLNASLQNLDADLQRLGSRLLCFRASESYTALVSLSRDLNAPGVVFNHLYDPISMVRDSEVKTALGKLGLVCRSFTGDVLREPWHIVDSQGKPYTTFDTFWAAHLAAEAIIPLSSPLPAPKVLPPLPPALADFGCKAEDLGIMTMEEELSNSQLEYQWQPGSAGARRLLQDFLEGSLPVFSTDRAKIDRNSTSRLSPYIHYGEISARSVVFAAVEKTSLLASTETDVAAADFLRQLGYREYSRYLSFHFPFAHERSLLEHLRAVPWRMDQSLFKAWRTGTTGHPLVDAGMREVWASGWMHNRMRVVCASFLVKHLLLPWQWGLKHYWDALLDADLECDALGWQYCAGCLTDGHDFSELMDLESEAKRFDPKGNYVRRWLPVLARLPNAYIHKPWAAPAEILAGAGVELGASYPWPVVLEEEAAVTLAAAADVIESNANSTMTVSKLKPARVGGGGEGGDGRDAQHTDGPFLQPTQYDPSAAGKVWGATAAYCHRSGIVAAPGSGNGHVLPADAAGAHPNRITNETMSEVQSNTYGVYSDTEEAIMKSSSYRTARTVPSTGDKEPEKERETGREPPFVAGSVLLDSRHGALGAVGQGRAVIGSGDDEDHEEYGDDDDDAVRSGVNDDAADDEDHEEYGAWLRDLKRAKPSDG